MRRLTHQLLELALCSGLLAFALHVTAQSSSSSGAAVVWDSSSTATAAPASNVTAGNATSSTGAGNHTAASTGAAAPKLIPVTGSEYCGYYYSNDPSMKEYYWSGIPRERATDIQYLDYLNEVATGQPVTNNTVPGFRGYLQCYGGNCNDVSNCRGPSDNCLDQFAAGQATYQQVRGGNDPYYYGYFCNQAPGDSNFVPGSFTKGDKPPPICVVYGGGNVLRKMNFYPILDQFALLTIQGSFNSSEGVNQFGHVGLAFQVEFFGLKTSVKHRYGTKSAQTCNYAPSDLINGTSTPKPGAVCQFSSGTTCTVVPFHTLVINMDQGVVTSLDWDDDCSLCSTDLCIDGNCAVPITQCQSFTLEDQQQKAYTAPDTDCDFKIYIAWQGTDSAGTYLSSAGKRLSQFRQWSLTAVYHDASNFDTANLPIVPADNQ